MFKKITTVFKLIIVDDTRETIPSLLRSPPHVFGITLFLKYLNS